MTNHEAHFSKLSKKLGIDFEEDITDLEETSDGSFQAMVPASKSNTALATITAADREADEERDYQKVRSNYEMLSSIGIQATSDLLRIAQLTSEPRAFEVVATLIKSLNETNKNLYGIHEESKKAKLSTIATAKENNASVTNIDKAVFVGSQSELLQQIEKSNKK